MDMYKRTFIYVFTLFVCLSLTFQREATFQNPFENLFQNFSKSPPFNCDINCNFSNLWDGSSDFLCFCVPPIIENFYNIQKHTRLEIGESFRENLIPISFLKFFSKYSWHTTATVDGVGRQSFSALRSIILWIILAVIASRCTYYQSQRFKHRFRVLVCKRQKMSLRLLLIKKKLTKLCTVKTVHCNLKASHKVSKSPRNNRLVQRHAMACKGKYRAKLWLCVQSRNIYSCTLGYLFLLLILCGDVHPNPGPVLPLHRRHPQAESLVVGAWNVRTLLGTTRSHVRPTAIVSRELSRYNIDVAALSETRILGETRIDEVGGGYTFFLKGKDLGERHYHGVGLAVRTSLLPLLNGKYPHGVNERLMTVNLHLDGCTLTLISAYAPTLCSSDEDKEVFYKKLNEIIKEAPVANKLLLLGDFNARVGTDHESWDGVLGHHGVGNENTNGTMLLSLCTRHQLTITNTLFNQEEQFITTWMHPGSKR